ncbi:hypothetical protein C9I98_09975 [Photobacterium sanctipauli]|uniref:Uncharacterized protein n=1 Tax=Photobacterium sanctipauli TaxID=1342794 RepID=A0A2T3NU27_9GAMM|nr:hypothetical protein C9I98_09975 [Photobacterium sanctipauli]
MGNHGKIDFSFHLIQQKNHLLFNRLWILIIMKKFILDDLVTMGLVMSVDLKTGLMIDMDLILSRV